MLFLDILKSRGLLAQVNHEDEFSKHLANGSRVAYVGIDPTAPSLHVGHLVSLVLIERWRRSGHQPLILIGGATAAIGDPTGKSEMRPVLAASTLRENTIQIEKQIYRIFSGFEICNNQDWLNKLNYMEFLATFGRKFSVNRMLAAECFKAKWEKGLSFLEFNYMILQAYDFYHLHKTRNCTVQMGGDDQWSNMLAGSDLIRRESGEQAYVCTVPLMTTADGKKMGKTEKGALWLDPDKVTPFDFYQYFRNTSDELVQKCLLSLTFLDIEEISELCAHQDHRLNHAKERLAFEVTKLVHGEEEANKSLSAAQALYKKADASSESSFLEGVPKVFVSQEWIGEREELPFLDLLLAVNIIPSKAEGRRLIAQKGLKIDELLVTDPLFSVPLSLIDAPHGILIFKGKKHCFRLLMDKFSI